MPLFTRRTPSSRLQRLMEKAPLVVAFFGLGAVGQAQAATYNVDTFADGLPPANLSLREAIIAANGGGATDTINLQAGMYLLNYGGVMENAGFGGDLDVTHTSGSLTIIGQGQGTTTISASALGDRVFHKIGNGTLTLRNLTIYGGFARDNGTSTESALGGGILAEGGSIILDNVEVRQGQAFGFSGAAATSPGQNGEVGAFAQGGGIYTSGSSLQIINGSSILNCLAFAGAGGDGMAAPSSTGGNGGEGGLAEGAGIYVASGTVTITTSDVTNNFALGGAGGDGQQGGSESVGNGQPGGFSGSGGAASGGGLYVGSGAGTVFIEESNVSSNRAYGGVSGNGGDGGDATGNSGSGGQGGAGNLGGQAQGGGIWVNNGSGTVSVIDTGLQSNFVSGGAGLNGGNGGDADVASAGSGGGGAFGASGGQALGGGLYVGFGLGARAVTLDGLSAYGNIVAGGAGGGGGAGGNAEAPIGIGGSGGLGGNGGDANGGGVWAGSGTIVLNNSDVTFNSAFGGRGGTGGRAGTGPFNAENGGNGGSAGSGFGGGIWCASAFPLTITGTTIQSNSVDGERGGPGGQGGDATGGVITIFGTGGNGGSGGAGGSAQGGGLYRVGFGALTIDDSKISFNTVDASYGGNGGAGGSGTDNGGPGNGGAGGAGGNNQGGGLYFQGYGALLISDTTISGNELRSNGDGGQGGAGGTTTTSSSSGNGGNGGNAGVNQGGGLWLAGNSTVTVERSTLFQNIAYAGGNGGDGGTGNSSGFGGQGGNVQGGGVYVSGSGTATIRNVTISGNLLYAGGAGGSGTSGPGPDGSGDGGGLYLGGGTLSLINSTIANNRADQYGGGLHFADGNLNASSILVGDNVTTSTFNPDAFGPFNSVGYSLIEDPNGHDATDGVNGNIVGMDAYLGALADNGGPTETHAIDDTSPAYNTGANTGGLGTDQRGAGFSRVSDGQADIGAFEFRVTTPAGNLDVRSLRINNVFRYPNKDQIILVVRFDNPGAVPPPRTPYPFDGIAVTFDIGGAAFNFTLDARGRSGTQCIARYLKRTNQIELKLNTGKGDFHDNFADEGLTDQRIVGQTFNVPVAFQFDATAGSGLVPVKYTCFSPSAGNGVGKGVLPPP